MDSFKRFNEDKLPDKSKFFSSLKDKCISEQEYDRTINVWKVFRQISWFVFKDRNFIVSRSV